MPAITKPIQTEFKHAETEAEITACFEVMLELRPMLTNVESFLEKVLRMQMRGYRLLTAIQNGVPVALAGYRVEEMLIHGRFLYVDDLITSESNRSQGLGEQLLQFIFDLAREQQLDKVILDTGIGNSLAQRFYFRMGMLATGMHFTYDLEN
jgi:ribosomal protein S18 acetylase RimI-like enzyme